MSSDKNDVVRLLQSLDIPHNEAETYAALLQIDSVSIRKIAAHTGINRGTTYEALKKLVALGLVSVKRQGEREHYTAESPEKIYSLIREKRRELLEASSFAKHIVPRLVLHQANPHGHPLVRYYEDTEGVAAILKDVLSTCSVLPEPVYYAYSSNIVLQFLRRKFPQFTKRRVSLGIGVKVIAVGKAGDAAEKTERKVLHNPPEGGISSYAMIYGTKLALISIASDDTPYGVVVEDAGAAAMQRLLFERLWETL